jgi:hypothetical protein
MPSWRRLCCLEDGIKRNFRLRGGDQVTVWCMITKGKRKSEAWVRSTRTLGSGETRTRRVMSVRPCGFRSMRIARPYPLTTFFLPPSVQPSSLVGSTGISDGKRTSRGRPRTRVHLFLELLLPQCCKPVMNDGCVLSCRERRELRRWKTLVGLEQALSRRGRRVRIIVSGTRRTAISDQACTCRFCRAKMHTFKKTQTILRLKDKEIKPNPPLFMRAGRRRQQAHVGGAPRRATVPTWRAGDHRSYPRQWRRPPVSEAWHDLRCH